MTRRFLRTATAAVFATLLFFIGDTALAEEHATETDVLEHDQKDDPIVEDTGRDVLDEVTRGKNKSKERSEATKRAARQERKAARDAKRGAKRKARADAEKAQQGGQASDHRSERAAERANRQRDEGASRGRERAESVGDAVDEPVQAESGAPDEASDAAVLESGQGTTNGGGGPAPDPGDNTVNRSTGEARGERPPTVLP